MSGVMDAEELLLFIRLRDCYTRKSNEQLAELGYSGNISSPYTPSKCPVSVSEEDRIEIDDIFQRPRPAWCHITRDVKFFGAHRYTKIIIGTTTELGGRIGKSGTKEAIELVKNCTTDRRRFDPMMTRYLGVNQLLIPLEPDLTSDEVLETMGFVASSTPGYADESEDGEAIEVELPDNPFKLDFPSPDADYKD